MLRVFLFFVCCTLPLVTSCSQGGRVDALTPARISLKKELIILDPGHGGADTGAKVQTVKEKVLALQTAILVKKYLSDKGYPVILTRSRDIALPLQKRTLIANVSKGRVFVSIHFNSCRMGNISGVEIYYYNKGIKWRQDASKRLAQLVLERLIFTTRAISRGVKAGNFHVIRETSMPAILIEGGFLTNQQERLQLKNRKYIEKIAHAIAEAIDIYFH